MMSEGKVAVVTGATSGIGQGGGDGAAGARLPGGDLRPASRCTRGIGGR